MVTSTAPLRSGRRSLLIDQHGRTLPLVNLADLPADAPAMVKQAVAIAHRHRAWPQFKILLGALAVVACVSILNQFVVRVHINPTIYWALVLVFCGRVSSYGGRRMIHTNGVRASTLCLAARICPSCAYNLSGVPEDTKGSCVCPECAGAWLLNAAPPAPLTGGARQTPVSGSALRV